MNDEIKIVDCVQRWSPHDVVIVEVRIQHGDQVLDLSLEQARCIYEQLGEHLAAIDKEQQL